MIMKLNRLCSCLVVMQGWDLEMQVVICRKSAVFIIGILIIVCFRHGMSYPISGLVKTFTSSGYDPKKPLVVSSKVAKVSVVKKSVFSATWSLSDCHGSCCF